MGRGPYCNGLSSGQAERTLPNPFGPYYGCPVVLGLLGLQLTGFRKASLHSADGYLAAVFAVPVPAWRSK